MTSQNPAAPNSQTPQLDRDILAKVNAHADRSLDRLFADIDGLLSGDLATDINSPAVTRASQHPQPAAEPRNSSHHPAELQQQSPKYLPESDFTSARLPLETEQPQPANPKPQKKRLPLWLKALLGISITSVAVGSGLLWLINERKIELPKNIDTTWLPFQSKSQVSPEDAKFAAYMQKSIAKIESAKTQATTTTNPVNPTNNIATTPNQAAPPSIINPTGTIAAAPNPRTVPAPQSPIALLKTFPTSRRPGAIFKINDRDLTVNVGQKIGNSNWFLLTVVRGKVILKKTGGEIRSIYVGQKF